jgi:hypothetical protein
MKKTLKFKFGKGKEDINFNKLYKIIIRKWMQ